MGAEVSLDKLGVGALIETILSEEEGLVLKNGRTEKPKKLVIVGVDRQKHEFYGALLVNTKINYRSEYSSEFLEAQYLLKQKDYPKFLRYDSYLDCGELFSFPISKLMAGRYFGILNDFDKEKVFEILETTPTLSTAEKKRFGIRRRSKQTENNV